MAQDFLDALPAPDYDSRMNIVSKVLPALGFLALLPLSACSPLPKKPQ